MSFLFINKTLRLNNLKIKTAMDVKISLFLICVKAIIYLLLFLIYCLTVPLKPYNLLFLTLFSFQEYLVLLLLRV